MGRNIKKGLDFYPFDILTYQDIKIRKLIRYKGGESMAVYVCILASIYKDGYYIRWDKDTAFYIAETAGLSEELVNDVLEFCLSIGLFNNNLFKEQNILTSKGIQSRFDYITKNLKRSCQVEEFNLLENINSGTNPFNSEETPVISETNPIISEETPIISGESATKKRKEIKGKEKKEKENENEFFILDFFEMFFNKHCTGEISRDQYFKFQTTYKGPLTETDFSAWLKKNLPFDIAVYTDAQSLKVLVDSHKNVPLDKLTTLVKNFLVREKAKGFKPNYQDNFNFLVNYVNKKIELNPELENVTGPFDVNGNSEEANQARVKARDKAFTELKNAMEKQLFGFKNYPGLPDDCKFFLNWVFPTKRALFFETFKTLLPYDAYLTNKYATAAINEMDHNFGSELNHIITDILKAARNEWKFYKNGPSLVIPKQFDKWLNPVLPNPFEKIEA